MLHFLYLLALVQAVFAVSGIVRTSGDVPSSYKATGPSPSTASFNFTIHLTGQNMAGLSTAMNKIAADGNGQWLTDQQLGQYASPSDAAIKTVTNFLLSSGISSKAITTSKYRDQIKVTSTVGQTAKLFSAKMINYNANGPTISRTKSFTIPASISQYVDDVSPLAVFGSIQGSGMSLDEAKVAQTLQERHPAVHQIRSNTVPISCNVSSVTPQCRKDYYGTASYTRSKGGSQADVAVVGFNNQYLSDDLMNVFYKKYAPKAVDYKVPVTAFNGAAKTGNVGFEATLNTEAVVAEIYPLTTTFLSMAPIEYREDPWLLAFNTLIEQYTATTRPKVFTLSYSGAERFFSASQGKIMCDAAQKLTALGTTIVVSTGDYGVAGDDGDTCPGKFNTRYPIGCPYILAVGATEGFSPEQPMEPNAGGLGLLSSGAGASNLFTIPTYQATQVKAYQKTIGSLDGYYNMSGRMYPDITAQGSRYSIIFRGRDTVGSGTSASTPYVAALFGLINDKRKKANKGTVGWAHPSLYKASLQDVTVGGSYGCPDTKLGFPSKSGYDAASGNGSPMFAALSKAYGV